MAKADDAKDENAPGWRQRAVSKSPGAARTRAEQRVQGLRDAAVAAGEIRVADTRRTALLMQQTVMYGWLMNRLVQSPRSRISAEDAWESCLRGLSQP